MSQGGVATAEQRPNVDAVFSALEAKFDGDVKYAPFVAPPEESDYRPDTVDPASILSQEIANRREAEVRSAIPKRIGGIAVEGFVRLDSLPGSEQTKERYRRFLGGIALHESVSKRPGVPEVKRRSSLDISRSAAEGDKESREALLINNRTHGRELLGGVSERFTVELDVDEERGVVWAGQTTEDRQFYALTTYDDSPVMRRSRHAEGRVGFALEDRFMDGEIEEGDVVIELSLVPFAPFEELSEAGYMLNEVALCLRDSKLLKKTDNGKDKKVCQINSLFAAGTDQRACMPKRGETEAAERERQKRALANRFDIRATRKLLAELDVPNADTMDPAMLLESAVVLKKPKGSSSEAVDGISIMMLYDHFASEELTNKDELTFFGSVLKWKEIGSPKKLTRKHYDDYLKKADERDAERESLYQKITDEQIRRQHEAKTPLEDAELKRRIVLDYVVDYTIDKERNIDPVQLGRVTREQVFMSRAAYENGNIQAGNAARNVAKREAVDSSCPPGKRKELGTIEGDMTNDEDSESKEDCDEVKDGDEVHCPYCDGDVRARVPKKGGRIYCSNPSCDAAHPSVKQVSRKEHVSELKQSVKRSTLKKKEKAPTKKT